MILLSYTWRDQALAPAVDRQLRQAGLEVWIDFRDLRLDANILSQVDNAIRRSDALVVIRPDQQALSPWMHAERMIARAYATPIIPFLADWHGFPRHVATIAARAHHEYRWSTAFAGSRAT